MAGGRDPLIDGKVPHRRVAAGRYDWTRCRSALGEPIHPVARLDLNTYFGAVKNFLVLSFSLFCFPLALFSQRVVESDLDRISEQLLDSIFHSRVSDDGMYVRRDDCLYGVEEELTLSCFSVGYELNWISDLNGDSIGDLLLAIEDTGLGAGGNNYGYDYEVITLDAQKRIKDKYQLFGGGKFSYAGLSIDSIANGRIYAMYQQNPNAYYEEEDFERDSVALEFFIENGKLHEVHYATCPLSEMNKRIFRNDLDYPVDRLQQLDQSYNEEQVETLFLADSAYYEANLSGCENIELNFNHSFPYNAALKTNKYLIKSTWVEHLNFLISSTRYSSMLSEVIEQLSKRKHQTFVPDEYGGFGESFVLKNNWTCSLYLSGNEEQYSYVTVRFSKKVTEDLPFWEELKRKF